MADINKELSEDVLDEAQLASLGYKQELKRGLGFFGSVGITLGSMQPLASAGVFQLGMLHGGPSEARALRSCGFVGYAATRMRKFGRVCGCCKAVLLIQFRIHSTVPSAHADDGNAGTSPAASQPAQFGIAVLAMFVGALSATFPSPVLNKIAHASFGWLVLGACLIVICIPAVAPARGINPLNGQVGPLRQTGSFVFATNPDFLSLDTQSNGVFSQSWVGSRTSANALTVCNGFLMAQYLILIFDTPGHLAEETRKAGKTVPRAILFSYFVGGFINFGLLLSFLFSVTNVHNAAIPGYGITATCPTINAPTAAFLNATGALPAWDGSDGNPLSKANDMAGLSGFGDLPFWDNINSFPGVPNDGIPTSSAVGACILSNGLSFSYFPIGNVFYDAFAARYPMCSPETAFGPATWGLDASGTLVDTGSFTGKYNVNNCWPVNTPISVLAATPGAVPCCDATGAIAASPRGRAGAMVFSFIIFGGSMLSIQSIFVGGSRFIFSFARDRGFPPYISTALAYVEPRTQAPLPAIVLYFCFGVAFVSAWLNSSPLVAFNAVSGLVSNGFVMVYGLPSLLRCTWGRKTFKSSPAFSLGRFSIPMAVLSAIYGAFSVATIALPSFYPINKSTVNYAPICLAAVIFMACLFLPLALDIIPVGWGYEGPKVHHAVPVAVVETTEPALAEKMVSDD